MACVDCFNNCPLILPDGCVQYTGDDIPALGICTGDTLSQVEQAIIDKLLTSLDGTGITVSEVTLENCEWLQDQFVGKSNTLANLFQLLIDNQCTLKEMIDDLEETPFAFDIKCLEGLTSTSTSDDILQSAINLLCTIKTTVDDIPNQYVKISDIDSYIAQYIANTATTAQYYISIPSHVGLPYFGDMGNFDNTGKGIESKGFKNIYVCNGQNGTPDLRGRVIAGAVKNIPGPSLDSAVDPTLSTNPNTNYSIADKFGTSYVTLTTNQIPSHTHTVTDPGHSHAYEGYISEGRPCGSQCDREDRKSSKTTSLSYTGISIADTGGGQSHDNRQPSIAACWIMAIY